jgi:CRISPR/Cas system CSM-associated protein Csm3 (group 7 of RAMP superfamily)
MPEGRWFIKDEDEGEGIIERIIVTGKLILDTAAHFGNGEVSILTDMPLLRDPLDGRALLSGASIAGAIRHYLREYENGYRKNAKGEMVEDHQSRAAHLFGYFQEETVASRRGQVAFGSLLMIDDALGEIPTTELRDGVTIDPKTRTAEEKKLYNMELLPPKSTFPLSFELLIPAGRDGGRFETEQNRDRLIEALVIGLYGLQTGQIGLGKRKRRGLGQVRVAEWTVKRYRLNQAQDLLAWLEGTSPAETHSDPNITVLLPTSTLKDQRQNFRVEAEFSLDGSSLLIRSAFGRTGDPDMVHLHSGGQPILAGTSLAGALRARALRIVKTLKLSQSEQFINKMFGERLANEEMAGARQKRLSASRVLVRETPITAGMSMVQSRVKLDRFTGGAYPGALFSQQPVFGTAETKVKVEITLLQPQEAEIGLLLLLLKDLWTGDLPLGGEASVGRGRLTGCEARLFYESAEPWELSNQAGKLVVAAETQEKLQGFVDKLLAQPREVN